MIVIGASIGAGLVAAVIALASFAFMVEELKKGKFPRLAPAFITGLLFGSTIASAPVGKALIDNKDVWAWYMLGETALFLPGAIVVVIRYLLLIYTE